MICNLLIYTSICKLFLMRIDKSFFQRDVLIVAPDLLGCNLVRCFDDGRVQRYIITEVEAYRGEEDKACHASKGGMTDRTKVMYEEGGLVYVYLIYGMYWLLNLVTGEKGNAQAVLIRWIGYIVGSGRVGRELCLDKSFYGEDLTKSSRLYIEKGLDNIKFTQLPRFGIDYADDEWKNKPWRYKLMC